MKKKLTLLLLSATASLSLIFSMLQVNSNQFKALSGSLEETVKTEYTLDLMDITPTGDFYGNSTLTSRDGNSISFYYYYYFTKGTFGRGYIENTSAINGLKSIHVDVVTDNKNLTISYGYEKNDFVSTTGVINKENPTYYFEGDTPSFFRISSDNSSAVEFTSMTLTYSCATSVVPDKFAVKYSGNGVIGHRGNPTNVVIDSIHGGYTIVSISGNAFSGCTNLQTVSIPNTVEVIYGDAFNGCISLQYNTYDNGYYLGNADNPYLVFMKPTSKSITSLTMHKDCKILYYGALLDCSSLASLELPTGLLDIGSCAFKNCTALTKLELPNGLKNISSNAFYHCSAPAITIPNTIERLEGNALFNYGGQKRVLYDSLDSLIKITTGTGIGLPQASSNVRLIDPETGEEITELVVAPGLTSMKSYTFWGCNYLTSVTLPEGLTNIAYQAFKYCTALSTLVVPTSVVSIGSMAFDNCFALTSIDYLGTKEQWGNISIDSNWLRYQGAVKTIHCTDGDINL